jgi:hypothetical protein
MLDCLLTQGFLLFEITPLWRSSFRIFSAGAFIWMRSATLCFAPPSSVEGS